MPLLHPFAPMPPHTIRLPFLAIFFPLLVQKALLAAAFAGQELGVAELERLGVVGRRGGGTSIIIVVVHIIVVVVYEGHVGHVGQIRGRRNAALGIGVVAEEGCAALG